MAIAEKDILQSEEISFKTDINNMLGEVLLSAYRFYKKTGIESIKKEADKLLELRDGFRIIYGIKDNPQICTLQK